MAQNRFTSSLIAAIDQGTSSTRFCVFDSNNYEVIAHHQIEINKIFPREGWVEQDPIAIIKSIENCVENVIEKLISLKIDSNNIAAVGISSQRESVLAWDKITGKPLHNSIVWQDNRTTEIVGSILDSIPSRDINFFKSKTGLPISTYFSAFKIKWLINNVPEIKQALLHDRLLVGTMDSWILWNLIGEHATDVTNASRTFLMNIETLEWDKSLCDFFCIPLNILPKIRSSGQVYGKIKNGLLNGIPIAAVIGDQHASLVELPKGQIKATYGTGCFIMQNVGNKTDAIHFINKEIQTSLITTIAFQLENQPPYYAVEGSVAMAGAIMTWLRDNVELLNDYSEIESLANQVPHSGRVFFVPAFQGLFAPQWDPNATGVIIGLTQHTRKPHLIRSSLEGIAFQTNDIISLMKSNSGGIRVDGGLSSSNLLCQMLADISGFKIFRPKDIELALLGAAKLAGYTMGIAPLNYMTFNNSYDNSHDVKTKHNENKANDKIPINLMRQIDTNSNIFSNYEVFMTKIDANERKSKINKWNSAVKRSLKWNNIEKQKQSDIHNMRLSTLPFGMFLMLSFASIVISNHLSK